MLEIRSLGSLQISIDGTPITFSARRAEVLLTYLAITDRLHERESLANLLWDDRTQKQTMANLRSLLAQMPSEVKLYLLTTRKTIGLVRDEAGNNGIWVDALAFETALTQSLNHRDTLSLYKGDFLDGVFVPDSRGLEEWIAVTRERLRRVALDAHETAATRALYARDYQLGIIHAQALVALDPLRETAQRLLMRLQVRAGQINSALRQYRLLADLLDEELGVPPSAETERLLHRIKAVRQHNRLQLPAQFTPFVGREKELAQIAERFDDAACRLLTLHGAGGIGKTRLALAAAEILSNDFMHGVLFVSLTSAETGDQALLAIANQLELPLGDDRPLIDQLIRYLDEKEILLLLDNAEQVVADLQPLLDTLLRQLPLLRILVTSRTRLQLRAEWVMPIAGMAHGHEAQEATNFFVSCAQRYRPTFAINTTNRSAVQRICQLLQGMPLGIELAATSIRQLSAEQIAQAIADNLGTLATQQYGVPTRQRSLQAAFDYSWQLLNEHEQQLLMQLSVFQAGFDQQAAEAVTGMGRWLHELVDKSLLQSLGDGRYGLHPAIRQFSAEKLAAHQLTDTTQQSHSRYYSTLLAELSEHLKDERQIAALKVTESAEANLEHGWRYAVAKADWPTIDNYLFSLHKHYEAKSRYVQAADIFAAAFAQLRDHPNADKNVLGKLLGNIGFHYERIGRLDEADAAFAQATDYLKDGSEQEALLTIFAHQGSIQYDRGNLEAAKAIYFEASQMARRYEDGRALAHCLSFLGYVETAMGDLKSAEANFQESIVVWRSEGTPRGLVIALNGLAELYESQGKSGQAKEIYQENLQICRDVGDGMGEARTLQNLGILALEDDDFVTARRHLEQALNVNETRVNNEWLDSFLSSRLAYVALCEHKLDEAESLYQHALTYSQQNDEKRGGATAHIGLGRVALLRDDLATAKQHLQAGLQLTHETDWLPMTLNALVFLAEVEFANGDKAVARQTTQLVLSHAASNAQSKAKAAELAGKNGGISATSAGPSSSSAGTFGQAENTKPLNDFLAHYGVMSP